MAAALSAVLLAAGGAAGYEYWHLDHNIKTVDISSALDDGTTDTASPSVSASATMPGTTAATGTMNILVLGSDTRSIPERMNFDRIPGISREVGERLTRVRPATLGQAARIPGVTPAAVAILDVYLTVSRET